MIGNAPHSPYTDVPGWLETDEEDTLIEYAKVVPEGGVIVNIGVEFGRSMAAFVKYAPAATVYGIEINPLDAYTANLTEAGLVPPALIVGNSSDKATLAQLKKKLKSKAVDVLFIDGGHSYNEALADLQLYTPLVKVGGFVLVHDNAVTASVAHPGHVAHPLHVEVSRAVADWKAENPDSWKAVKTVHTMLVLEKTA